MAKNPDAASRGEVVALCMRRAGYRKGAQLGAFIIEWELVTSLVGGLITIEDFARESDGSRATAYRRLGLFRDTFPELGPAGSPNDVLRPHLEAMDGTPTLKRKEARRGDGSRQAPLGSSQTA